jgi:hypothetical protein
VVAKVLRLCDDIWRRVLPVLTSDSPEGNIRDMITKYQTNGITTSPQEYLSNSWRGLKEASSLLGAVLPFSQHKSRDYDSAGNLFLKWLANIRHRGSFTAIIPSFEKICRDCFQDTENDLITLPAEWLNVSPLISKVDVELHPRCHRGHNSFIHETLCRNTNDHRLHPLLYRNRFPKERINKHGSDKITKVIHRTDLFKSVTWKRAH